LKEIHLGRVFYPSAGGRREGDLGGNHGSLIIRGKKSLDTEQKGEKKPRRGEGSSRRREQLRVDLTPKKKKGIEGGISVRGGGPPVFAGGKSLPGRGQRGGLSKKGYPRKKSDLFA